MDGQRVFKFATRVMADSVRKVVTDSGLTVDDIDLIIPHQANDRIIELARRRLRVPPEKMMVNIDRYGNTSAASIPLALVDAVEEGRLKPGDHLVFVGFGAGLTWAAAAFHWEPQEPVAIPVADWPVARAAVPACGQGPYCAVECPRQSGHQGRTSAAALLWFCRWLQEAAKEVVALLAGGLLAEAKGHLSGTLRLK